MKKETYDSIINEKYSICFINYIKRFFYFLAYFVFWTKISRNNTIH